MLDPLETFDRLLKVRDALNDLSLLGNPKLKWIVDILDRELTQGINASFCELRRQSTKVAGT